MKKIQLLLATIVMGFFLSGASKGFDFRKNEESPSKLKETSTVWVAQSDGAQSCTPGSGLSLAQAAEILKKAHIAILDSKKGSDGKFHAQMCGADQGTTNLFLISRENLGVAVSLGYRAVTEPSE